MDYDKQAQDFMEKHEVEMSLRKIGLAADEMFGDNKLRARYRVKIARQVKGSKKEYEFDFTDSLANTQKVAHHYSDSSFRWVGDNRFYPKAYGILSCLTSRDPGSLDDFCSDFGYNPDSIKDNRLYRNVCEEYEGLRKLFSQKELDEMAEIQ